jgi:hypothetical protein
VTRRFDVVRRDPDDPQEPPRLRADGVPAGATWVSVLVVLVLLVFVVVAVAILVSRYL